MSGCGQVCVCVCVCVRARVCVDSLEACVSPFARQDPLCWPSSYVSIGSRTNVDHIPLPLHFAAAQEIAWRDGNAGSRGRRSPPDDERNIHSTPLLGSRFDTKGTYAMT